MIGQGVLRACLLDPEVERVVSVVRSAGAIRDPKLHELVHADFTDFSAIAGELASFDACLFCLGVSSAGMSEAEYRKITYDVTLAAARVLANPAMTFIYISGAGSGVDKRAMWAKVKGATENALLELPFKRAYSFRPGYIQPRHGIRSRTKWTRIMYAVFGPLYPLWRLLFPRFVTTTDELARAMLNVAKHGAPAKLIESREFRALATP